MLNTCHHSAVDVTTSANSSSSSLKRNNITHFCFGPVKVKGLAYVHNLQMFNIYKNTGDKLTTIPI